MTRTMHWKVKALMQNAVARLPSRWSYAAYYGLQRRFGGLRNVDPRKTVRAAVEIAAAIRQHGRQIADGVVLEVGTGRRLNLPILLWLMGARRVISVDLHPYLKAELIAEDLTYYRSNRDEVADSLRECSLHEDRLEQLLDYSLRDRDVATLMDMCSIQYLAPADAGKLPLADGTIDFHVSTNVFEHIPPAALAAILQEASRVLASTGLAVHRIDHSDHFSHSDPTLSAVNFLRYDERQWARFAGNRYMYMNRLQFDDFEQIYADSGHDVLLRAAEPDEDLLRQLHECPPPLDTRFAGKPMATLATLNSLIVSRPRHKNASNAQDRAAYRIAAKRMDTRQLANRVRVHAVNMTSRGGSSHVGAALSIADVLAVLYGGVLNVDPAQPEMRDRDRFILSKGHAGAAVYATLAEVGFFPIDKLATHYQDGSDLSGHVSHKGIPGVELSTGSLGHGLSVGAGMAFSAKLKEQCQRVFVLLSDGECDEGSNWEAILFAAHHRLDNLVAIVDYNKIQSLAPVAETIGLEPFADKWRSFGWSVAEADGHCHEELQSALSRVPAESGKPTCLIAHTTKGKGVSFMEDSVMWHYRTARGDELAAALAELESAA